MQWRPIVMLLVGLTVVFLVSLISDPPYPRPVQLTSDDRKSYSKNAANKVILTVAGGFLYQTAIWFETANTMKHGIGPMKTGAMGKFMYIRIIYVIEIK